jgi:hypothetical protein
LPAAPDAGRFRRGNIAPVFIGSTMSGEAKAFSWLACGAAVVLLVSPLKVLWARASLGWLATFAVWLLLIVGAAWINRTRGP